MASGLQIHNIKILRHYLRYPVFYISLFLSSFLTIQAQFYEYGQDPGSIKWSYITSGHYQLIYPRGLDSLACIFADELEYFYPYQSELLDQKHQTLPVIIHNESSFSNGVFLWAPKRLEVFTNPDPNGYAQNWMTQLAIHEGRHAFQVSKLNQGFSKGLSYIVGEQAVGAITGMLPVWYLEGDAVDAETRFSNSGRGRLPSFEMGTKAILLEKGERYSFSKAVLGSYKDYIPNHYQIGYLMVRYGRRTYGNSFWRDMEDYVARKPFLLNPSYFSMKKYGITSKKAFYQSTLDFYEEHWKKLNEKRISDSSIFLSRLNKLYTNYNFPQYLNDSQFVAYKSGLDQIPEFVIVDNEGREKTLFRPGYLNSGRFNYNKGMLIWDEWIPDVRWSNRNYSVLKVLDIHSGIIKQLKSKTRYYSPSFSRSGNNVAVIEQRTDNTFYLLVLDLNGKPLHSIRSPEGSYIQQPVWMEEDSALVLTLTNDSGKYLYAYSLRSNSWKKLYFSGFDNISNPEVSGANVFFSSTKSGINNIYMYRMNDQRLHRITSSEFGAFEPSLSYDASNLVFSDYHSLGYRIKSLKINSEKFYNAESVSTEHKQIDFEHTVSESAIIEGSTKIVPGIYKVRPYNKFLHALNIHSWLPLYFDYLNPEAALNPEQLPVSPGATIVSQNLLSTVTGMIGYEYTDKLHFLHTGVRLKGRFPIFDINLNYGGYPLVAKKEASDIVALHPNRMTLSFNTHVFIRLNTGKYISIIQPFFSYTYSSDILPDINGIYVPGISKMHYRLYFSSYLRKGVRDILPRFGVNAVIGYRNAPFNSYNYGSLSYNTLSIYLPGIIKHQTIKLGISTQQQNPENYFFSNSISVPRGMETLYGLDLKLYTADYTFPIGYPDLNIGAVFYIKRIRGNIWTDYLRGKDIYISDPSPALEDRDYYTYGADLLVDFHLFRFFFPVSMGARLAYLPEKQQFKPELLLSIAIN